LSNIGLDPKHDLENEHVSIEACNSLFRGLKKINIQFCGLKLKAKVAMEDIYWRSFGTTIITNYKIPPWNVHGFIAQTKGYEITWAKAMEST
jgi:hypothetical protein